MKSEAKGDDDGVYKKTWHNECSPEVYHLAAGLYKHQPQLLVLLAAGWQRLNTGSGQAPLATRGSEHLSLKEKCSVSVQIF